VILSFCVVTFTSIFFLRIRDFNALYSALSSFSSVYAMSSFAVFIFLFWKSVIAWCAIFVYFPLVGISADSVTPLYSIFISVFFCFVWLFVFCGVSCKCYAVCVDNDSSCGVALAIME